MNTIQGYGMYLGEQVTIIGSYKDELLIIDSHNPINCEWVIYTEVDHIVWVLDTQNVA